MKTELDWCATLRRTMVVAAMGWIGEFVPPSCGTRNDEHVRRATKLGPMNPAFRILALVLWSWASLAGCSAADEKGGTGGGGGMPCTTPQDCPDAANECVTRTCLDGMCGTASVAAGTACSDGDACTQSDTCQGGICAGSPVVCAAPDACHVKGTCDPVTGMCSNPEAPDGTECVFASACVAGACIPDPITYIKASNTGEKDDFGYSVALSADGNTLAVGAYRENSNATGIDGNQANNSVLNAGAVYVFVRSGGTWAQEAYVKASNTGAEDHFGDSVALSADGSTLAVGTPWEASNATGIDGNQADDSASQAGAVYVFTRSGGTWSQQAYVKASNAGAGDYFGGNVALSGDGNTLAVGAPGEASNATGINGNQADDSAGSAGAVYMFTRSGGTWSQEAYVKASNTGGGDGFGSSVAVSGDGNTLAVGADEDSNATGVNGNQADDSMDSAGAVYVFTRSGGTWSQEAYVKASNTGKSDEFGINVALSENGNTLAVGAVDEDSNATGINGNQADESAFGAGAVYVFARSGGTWSQEAYVKASNTNTKNAGWSDGFGMRVALSGDGNTLAVGAAGEASNATGINGNQADTSVDAAGAVYMFMRSAGAWSQEAYVKASNTGGGDVFGVSVALSGDGKTLAVGAIGEDSDATGVNDNQHFDSVSEAGAVYVY